MTSVHVNQKIASMDDKPVDYTDISSFEFALGLLNSSRPEFFVARVMMVIFGYYFPARLENWCIAPEVRVVGGIPDLVVEKFVFDDDLDVHEMFEPRLTVELKSQTGKSTTDALNQSIDAMKSLLESRGQDSILLRIVERNGSTMMSAIVRKRFRLLTVVFEKVDLSTFHYDNEDRILTPRLQKALHGINWLIKSISRALTGLAFQLNSQSWLEHLVHVKIIVKNEFLNHQVWYASHHTHLRGDTSILQSP